MRGGKMTNFRFVTEKADGTGTPKYSNPISVNLTTNYQAIGLFSIIGLVDTDESHKCTLQVKDATPKKIKLRNILLVQSNVGGDYDHVWSTPEEDVKIINVPANWTDIDDRCYYLFASSTGVKGYVEAKI